MGETPLADEVEEGWSAIREVGDTLGRIQQALEERKGPDTYGVVLIKIRDILEEHDG